jgi:hypothetical protein
MAPQAPFVPMSRPMPMQAPQYNNALASGFLQRRPMMY